MTTREKPPPERRPLGAAEHDPGESADVDVITRAGRRFVVDVRTVNVQCASAVRSSAQAQCTAIEAIKRKHYDKYYRSFAPFVNTVSGGVSQASAEARMRLMRAVARGDHSILDWEPARWMDDILHRLAVEMVKTAAVIATRAVLAPRDSPHERCPTGRAVPCRAMPCRDSRCHMR